MNDSTFEEKVSLRLSRLNVFIVFGIAIIMILFVTTYVIAFSPLKEYIPGYSSDPAARSKQIAFIVKTDSLEEVVRERQQYIDMIKKITLGKDTENQISPKPVSKSNYSNINITKSKEDSMLRTEFNQQEQYNLEDNEPSASSNGISNFFFFCPLKGLLTNGFNPTNKHYGIDIVSPNKDESIKATLSGTVIFTGWTLETGYVIALQHSNNLISIYKHNSVILKKTGTYVKAGEAIAIIGNSGELTSGPHLHFELWYNGYPINPRDYIVF
jgi:murein DD-endopeptidase MepM/ murein hydrolase activator NlpD